MTKQGLFITFEGADGCGKTTQLNKIADFLREQGYEVLTTREPGSLEVGKRIRDIVLHYNGEVSDNCEMFLFLADRSQHVDTFIKPALKEGKIVLCDRHTDSTIAFQGYARGNDIEKLTKLNAIATNGLSPDLTLLFDVETEVAQQRVGNEKDRIEAAGAEFHRKVRNGYLEIAKQFPDRVKVINANNPIETVYKDSKNIIINILNSSKEK